MAVLRGRAEVGQTEPGCHERVEAGGLHRGTELGEGALHESEVHSTHDLGVLLRDLQERATVQRDGLPRVVGAGGRNRGRPATPPCARSPELHRGVRSPPTAGSEPGRYPTRGLPPGRPPPATMRSARAARPGSRPTTGSRPPRPGHGCSAVARQRSRRRTDGGVPAGPGAPSAEWPAPPRPGDPSAGAPCSGAVRRARRRQRRSTRGPGRAAPPAPAPGWPRRAPDALAGPPARRSSAARLAVFPNCAVKTS